MLVSSCIYSIEDGSLDRPKAVVRIIIGQVRASVSSVIKRPALYAAVHYMLYVSEHRFMWAIEDLGSDAYAQGDGLKWVTCTWKSTDTLIQTGAPTRKILCAYFDLARKAKFDVPVYLLNLLPEACPPSRANLFGPPRGNVFG